MDLREAISLIHQGNALLLLGAGFSTLSENSDHQKLPTGGELASLLCAKLNLPNKYTLPVVASRFADRNGEGVLVDFLRSTFDASVISPDQERIALLPWRRMYTLNYDNIVEKIYSRRNRDLRSIDVGSHVAANEGTLQYIHLHGDAFNSECTAKSLILGVESYNSLHSRSGWFSRFKTDIELADCVIAVGCSMSDIHISSLFFNDPILQGKTFFVDVEDLDEVWADNLARFGHIEPIGIRRFSDLIASTPASKLRRREHPISFNRYEPPTQVRSPTGDDIFDLVLAGNTKCDVLPTTRPGPFDYLLWRDDAESLLNDIDSKTPAHRYIIHSDLGNGKSALLTGLKLALSARGYEILSLKQVRDILSTDVAYLSGLSGKVAIIIEDIFRSDNRRDAISLLNQFSHFTYIATCRTSVFDLQSHELSSIFGRGYLDYDVNALSDTEIAAISGWFDANGLWGSEAGEPSVKKQRILSTRCGREFRSIIIDRFRSAFMQEKIDAAFRSIPSGQVRTWLLTTLLINVCGFDSSPRFVHSLIGYAPARRDFEHNGSVMEFIGTTSNSVSIRSPVLGEFLLRDKFDKDEKVAAVVGIAKACARNSTGRDVYSELIKFLYRPHTLIALFPSSEYLSSAKALFDQLKLIDSLQSKSLFWLQYAIILTNEKDYFGAKVIFDTAFGKAKNSDFDTFHIDTHYARYLLESRMHAPRDHSDAFHAFLEAHKRVRNQILKDRSAIQPYRVAELYPSFFASTWHSFDQQQQKIIRRAATEMVDFLANARVRHRAQKLARVKAELEEMLSVP